MFHFQDFGTFARSLKCFPVIMMGGKERKDVDKGGKIILPPSALDHLTRLHIQFPMLFKLTNRGKNRETHCGVLEFVAEEGRCYLPYWMMKNLLLKEGEIIDVKYVNLEIAKFAKFQPQSVDFLEISNPKAVLENSLRNFATLTKGDVISINYNDKDYEVCILETRPGNAVSIIECDMDVDFAPPVGYEEPAKIDKFKPAPDKNLFINNKEKPPVHEGYRLDGKPKKNKYPSISSSVPGTSSSFGGPGSYGACAASSFTGASSYESNSGMLVTDGTIASSSNRLNDESLREEETKGSPYYDYQIGLLRFNRNFSNLSQNKESNEIKQEPQVKGYKLRDIKVN